MVYSHARGLRGKAVLICWSVGFRLSPTVLFVFIYTEMFLGNLRCSSVFYTSHSYKQTHALELLSTRVWWYFWLWSSSEGAVLFIILPKGVQILSVCIISIWLISQSGPWILTRVEVTRPSLPALPPSSNKVINHWENSSFDIKTIFLSCFIDWHEATKLMCM